MGAPLVRVRVFRSQDTLCRVSCQGAICCATMADQEHDEVGRFVNQWAAERPDLDLRTMATVARLLNVARHIQARLAAFAAEYGLSIPEGDVLFTLRRAGPPYRLSPSAIAE